MKKLTVSTFLAIILIAVFVGPASADGPEVVEYPYIIISNPPIPVGEVVEFVDLGSKGRLALHWVERIRMGFVDHLSLIHI